MCKSLKEYFERNSHADHIVTMKSISLNDVTAYIHPHNIDGDTFDFMIRGNDIIPTDANGKPLPEE